MSPLFVASLAWGLGPLAFAPPQTCEGRVRGEVIDRTTAEPVPRVTITVDGEATTETDEAGRFEVDGLCRGEVDISVGRADYHGTQRRYASDGSTTGHVDFSVEPFTVDRLDDVVVVAPAMDEAGAGGGASTRLEGDALDRTRGKNLADAITKVPGVAVLRSSAGGLGKPIIRGQFGRRNLILFDRVRHESQKWGLDHAPEVDPFAAGGITVIRGPGALRYGADAVGGVVLIDPVPLSRTAGYAGEAHLVGVSNGRRGTAAARVDGSHAVGGLTNGHFAWRAEGNVTRGAALRAPDYALDNTGVFNWNAGARAGYLSDEFDFVAAYRRHFMKSGLCSCLRNETADEFEQALTSGRPAGVENYEVSYAIDRAFSQVAHDLAMARARIAAGDAGDLSATYAFQLDDRTEWDVVRSSIQGPQLTFALATHAGDLAFEHRSVPLGARWSVTGVSGIVTARQTNAFDSASFLIPDYAQWSWGAYVTERFMSRHVDVEVGARYDGLDRVASLESLDFQGQVGAGRLDAEACEVGPDGTADCRTTFHAPSGSLGLVGHVVEGLDLRLDLSSTARFASVDELYMNGEAPSFPVLGLGRGDLRPERTWGTSLTASYATDWVAMESSGYFNYIDDYIYFAPSPSDGPLGIVETIKGPKMVFTFEPRDALFWGFEYGFDLRPETWPVSFDGQVSIVRAQDTDGDYLVFIPADRLTVGAKLHWSKFLRRERRRVDGGFVGMNGQFVAQQLRYDPNDDFAPPPSGYVLLGAETGVDVYLRAERTPTTPKFSFALVGANLTNARYRDYTSLLRYYVDEPGWELSLRMSVAWASVR